MKTIIGRLDLRYITAKEQKHIEQATRFLNISANDRDLKSKFMSHKWKRYNGVYKVAYIKGNIVTKLGPSRQLIGEIELWEWSRGKSYRKNLVRSFGMMEFKNGLYWRKYVILQRKAPRNKDGVTCYKTKCRDISAIMGIEDGRHNHGHDKDGNPVWFDTNVC